MAMRELVCICGKPFTTDKNAKKYCSEKCYRMANRKKYIEKITEQTCAFCGKTFSHMKKKKYCSVLCRQKANGRKKDVPREKKKLPMTLEQIAVASRAEGLSYGQYVAKHGL